MNYKHPSFAISFCLHLLVIAYGISIIRMDKNLNVIPVTFVNVASLQTKEFVTKQHNLELKKIKIDKQQGITKLASKLQTKASAKSQLSRVIINQDKGNETLASLLHNAIAKVQTYPEQSLALDQSGIVRVAFVLSPTGNTSDVHLIQSSGYATLDNAALQAVIRATPFAFAKNYLSSARLFSVDVDYES